MYASGLYLAILVLFYKARLASSITSDGYRVEHGSSPTLGNYVYAQNLRNSQIIRGKKLLLRTIISLDSIVVVLTENNN